MKYQNPTNPGAILSQANKVKQTKELLFETPQTKAEILIQKYSSNGCVCGIENPCTFGKWNEKLNKNCLF